MEDLGDGSEGRNQMEPTQQSLICGLPDDIALSCLARVPRKYHRVLKCVSRRWRDLVCGDELSSYRKIHKLEETWIYALCKDKLGEFRCYVLDPNSPRRCWKPIEELPRHCSTRQGMSIQVLGKKVYLLGGFDWYGNCCDEVYVYDTSRNIWSEGVPLPTGKASFSCEVLDEKIYVLGGVQSRFSSTLSFDTYDPQTSMWTSHPHPHVLLETKGSFVMGEKIYINSAAPFATACVHSLAYEPSSNTCHALDDDMVSGWRGPAVVVDGRRLYVLDESSGTRLMMWQKDVGDWVLVGRLSHLRTRPPCQLVAVGKTVFVVGKGLSTVVLDVDSARNVEGAIACSSIPELDSVEDVIRCRCLAI